VYEKKCFRFGWNAIIKGILRKVIEKATERHNAGE
jgi:hypothetical protein